MSVQHLPVYEFLHPTAANSSYTTNAWCSVLPCPSCGVVSLPPHHQKRRAPGDVRRILGRAWWIANLKDACVVIQEDFWPNLLRYGTYFFSVLLGTVYTALKPIGGLLKRPVTAVFTIAAIVGLLVFVSTTVRAMLGVSGEDLSNDLDYLLR